MPTAQSSTTQATDTPRPPGRPRSARAHEAIIDAVVELLAEGTTVEALSIEAVAARAGVGKATIYRHWPHKDALLLDAIASTKQPIPELAGESIRDDLVKLVGSMSKARDSVAAKILPCLIPELQRPGLLRDAYLEFLDSRREAVRGVLRRGIASGEIRPDIDIELAVGLLAAPMMMSVLGSAPKLSNRQLPERVVDTVLRGIAA
jgi:AcrR family transcriptional regulator